MLAQLHFGTSCRECGRGLLIDDEGEKYCPECTRWTCRPDDADELVDLAACARGGFGDEDESDVRTPLPPRVPMTCWKCDAARDCGFDPCPHCSADCVPF